jgi:hypothetical protein
MNEFYKKYHTNKTYFGELIGVGTRTLVKFADGKQIRESSRARIELAIRVFEKYNLERPQYDNGMSLWNRGYNTYFHIELEKYNRKVKELIEKESKSL